MSDLAVSLIRCDNVSAVAVQKQGRFEVYEGDAQPPMSPPVGQGQGFMDQNLGSKPTTPEHST